MENSNVDFILLGGDYDFSLKALVEALERGDTPPPGFMWHGENGEICGEKSFCNAKNDLNTLRFSSGPVTAAHANIAGFFSKMITMTPPQSIRRLV